MAAQSAYCPDCGIHRTRDAATVRAGIVAVFGVTGLAKYEAELRSGRIQRSRSARITVGGRRST